MPTTRPAVLPNAFVCLPEPCERLETAHRRLVTSLPVPESVEMLRRAAELFPEVNCYQAPVIWDRAEGYQVFDPYGNCWIDFSSTAVMTNTGHGHPRVRAAVADHARQGLLAQFSFASEIRLRLAEKLIELSPPGIDKVYFWTTGSEATESALRLVREWGIRRSPEKAHVITFTDNYHGCTLGATQLSGSSASRPWLAHRDQGIHHLPFPVATGEAERWDALQWEAWLDTQVAGLPIRRDQVAGVFIETLQGWGALPLPLPMAAALRSWSDRHDVKLVFDEIQTGFGRTGRWFGHEHYGIRADMMCVAKGISSSLPLAAVLGPAEILDGLSPGSVTTTHAAHPLSCAAALANLEVLEDEQLVDAANRKGQLAGQQLAQLQARFPRHISRISGLGLLQAIHLADPDSGAPDPRLARDLTWESVKRGVMLFQTNRTTVKVCPPLVIPDEALVEGIAAIGEALAALVE